MNKDIEIIKKIENQFKIKLPKRKKVQFSSYGYVLNSEGNVSFLSIPRLRSELIPQEIYELKGLLKLYLNESEVTHISKDLLKCTKLLYLEIYRECKVKSIDLEIFESRLEVCSAANNYKGIVLIDAPLVDPPAEIVHSGKSAIRAYFKSKNRSSTILNELKVLLVGEGAAGKTSIIERIKNNNFNRHEPQTHGIKINKWNVEYESTDVHVNLWDFGGQEIMHSTHQFFLSERSLYILVLDGRKEEKVEYWLKHIESFGGRSPILIVINKTDENPSFDVNRRFLTDKYENIVGFHRVSCLENKGIEDLKKGIIDSFTSVKVLGTKWPTSWFKVKTHLENIRNHFISYNKFNEICEFYEVSDDESKNTLLRFLHDLGVILHFRDFALLDTHVLEPEWVTQAVYKIINSQSLYEKRGFLELSDLSSILRRTKYREYSYPESKHKYIIDLMLKFKLCYKISDESVLIPDLLDVQEPEIIFDFKNSISMVIKYDFLPRSIMPKLQVALNKDIVKGFQWRTGMLLEDEVMSSKAIIKSDNRESKLYIYISGKSRRDYLTIIRHEIKRINISYKKLSSIENIPLPDNENILVSYEHLRRLESKGIKKYLPEGAEKEYKVSELLGNLYVSNDNEEKIAALLEKLHEDGDSEENLMEKANSIIQIQPNFFGMGINVNALVKRFSSKK